MAENVQETRPPEPPPRPPEVPKPTAQSNRSEAGEHGRSNESQQSAQQDARTAVQAEHAKATNGAELERQRPTSEAQERSDAHSAEKMDRDAAGPPDSLVSQRSPETSPEERPQDSLAEQRPPEASPPVTNGDRDAAAPIGVGDRQAQPPGGAQAEEHAAVRQAAAEEGAKAAEGETVPGEATGREQVGDLTPQPNPWPEVGSSPIDNQQERPPLTQPSEAPLPATTDSITTTPAGESLGAERSPEVVDEETPQLPVVEQATEREPEVDETATDKEEAGRAAAESGDQDAQRQAQDEQGSPEETPTGKGPTEPGYDPPDAKDATPARDGAAEHDDVRNLPDIADEIASCQVDIRTKPHVNSAGETVDRYIIDDAEDLLPVAEHFGIGELSHDKEDYYSGQLPDGRYRKIEWNMKGHSNTNEGPHVKVMETEDPMSAPSRGNRWKTKAMIFVDGHEQFKKQWH